MKNYHSSDIVYTLKELEEILSSLRSAADCKCQRCLGKQCHYNGAYCSKVKVLDAFWPGWFEEQTKESFKLGKFAGGYDKP